jgi:hypothetical protein
VRVIAIDPGFGAPGHDYIVETPPMDYGDGHLMSRVLAFAAIELEPCGLGATDEDAAEEECHDGIQDDLDLVVHHVVW